ncbi:hypothetical protein [Jiulongibacter sp. NS-SX5]|uniref:hypothetical protein n=1 Tax=Jiulongibacter sp. NS-SX5 TaxID=3463854 RepID=UPI004059B143
MKKLKLHLFLAAILTMLNVTVGHSQSINGNQFQPGKLVTDTLVVNHVATIPGGSSGGGSPSIEVPKDTVMTISLNPFGGTDYDAYGYTPFTATKIISVLGFETNVYTGIFGETRYQVFSPVTSNKRIVWGFTSGYLIIYSGAGGGDPETSIDILIRYIE